MIGEDSSGQKKDESPYVRTLIRTGFCTVSPIIWLDGGIAVVQDDMHGNNALRLP